MKELKKKHSSRLVGVGGDGQPGWREHATRQWLEDWVVPHLLINWEEQLGSEKDSTIQASSAGKRKPQKL